MAVRLPLSRHTGTLHTGIHAMLPVLPFMLVGRSPGNKDTL